MGHAMRRAASQLASSFSPLQVGWTHAHWAEGPEFLALGLSNGAAVSNWPDEIGTADLVQATETKQPAYAATGGANSKPAIDPDGGDWLRVTYTPSIAQPVTVVVVGAMSTSASGELIDGAVEDTGYINYISSGGGTFRMYAGAYITGPTGNTSPHLFMAYYNGASSVLGVDGSETSGNAGTAARNGVTVFGRGAPGNNENQSNPASFVGVFTGDVRTDPKWAQFKAWVTSHYGITVA